MRRQPGQTTKAFRIHRRALRRQAYRIFLEGGLVCSILGTLYEAEGWEPWEQGKPFLVSWQEEAPDEDSISEMERRFQKEIATTTQEFGEKGLADWFESLTMSKGVDDLYHPLRPVVIS